MTEKTHPPVSEKQQPSNPLPGNRATKDDFHRMMRVDHAGEFGAVRIYEGQLAVLGDKHPKSAMIRHMQEQEKVHLATFNKLLSEEGVRPTLLSPFWHAAGFALGAGTALMGEKAAMACTAAVEEVIDEHYEEQLQKLEGSEPAFEKTIKQFQAEEIEHREIALEHGAEDTPGYGLLSGVIKAGCKLAIWTAKKI
ncbi:demethoxyubiquinone hydroxylase family protein [Temperatibacter marinus]|uniref:3-demethoxyubiquinol 3-hydroxylase n=1 Tax=Temperatibacter marinus TaxID=1456591 RepID=A0AA52HBH4_9PROT|nr:demethoxyubiquinone hydroxylase family protein [Temperatibacter marinus]WND03755.1 demethoxyubiquinone hydroxylase family protein [Temperatibacter marinus]